ncbi:MAG: hypothetical protein O7G86_17425 [Gammaproteobacteria bacterium]|nr:hypothetical protein [Gammaproteobacteria bacterium]
MDLSQIWMITESPGLSGLIWLLIVVVFMYLGRQPAKQAIHSTVRIIYNMFRFLATAARLTEQRMEARNHDVLLASGREAKERIIEREFDRIGDTVQRDLSRYPELQRTLAERIQRIDDDHQNATDVPPDVPGWTKAVEAIAKIPARADPTVRDVLESIHQSVDRAHHRSLAEYRKASSERHRLLSRMMPQWRHIQSTLSDVGKSVSILIDRSRSIDRHMDEYSDIVRGTDRALHTLSASSLVHFFVSAFVLAVAVGGAFINFSLIARPMSEMVGGTSYIGSFQTANIAALVIILVEITMGLFLMESLRITRLFPVVGALPDRLRIRMGWIALVILATLATVEAGLAYMREILLQDELATMSLLRGTESLVTSDAMWITTAAQMGMGFVLPFALTFAAIPLETFVHTLRTVVGMLFVFLLRLLTVALRVVANGCLQLGPVLSNVYDLVIFGPLWLEDRLRRRNGANEQTSYAVDSSRNEEDYGRYHRE